MLRVMIEAPLKTASIALNVPYAAAPAVGMLIKGFLSTPSLTGAAVESHTGLLTLDTAEMLITSGTITIANQFKMIEEEVPSDTFFTDFAASQRSVTGKLKCFVRRTYASLSS
ncbi:hypothetical protein DFAR_2500029 [Desulfarculales bacterium]